MSMQTIDLQLEMLLSRSRIGELRPDVRSPRDYNGGLRAGGVPAMALAWILLGISIFAAIIMVLASVKWSGGVPDVLLHGMIALILGQCAVAIGTSIKVIKQEPKVERSFRAATRRPMVLRPANDRGQEHVPPPLPALADTVAVLAPRVVVTKGKLGERDFTEFSDGSVEVLTLLGLRRFTSLEEAQEFVGGISVVSIGRLPDVDKAAA